MKGIKLILVAVAVIAVLAIFYFVMPSTPGLHQNGSTWYYNGESERLVVDGLPADVTYHMNDALELRFYLQSNDMDPLVAEAKDGSESMTYTIERLRDDGTGIWGVCASGTIPGDYCVLNPDATFPVTGGFTLSIRGSYRVNLSTLNSAESLTMTIPFSVVV
jgi:hypothetical protein